MPLVVLQIPGPVVEDIPVDLARVPVKGDFLEFREEYPDDHLAGEQFEVRSVIFDAGMPLPDPGAVVPVEGRPQDFIAAPDAPEPPVVVLRKD